MDLDQHPGKKIKWIIDNYEKGNSAEFARKVALSGPTVKSYIDEKTKPGYDALQSILRVYPQINLHWFILNQGPIQRELQDNELDILEENHRLREGIKSLYAVYVEGNN
ncbi:hypothetical protein [Roseivirga seohaensis]|uniref:HTH cro/C1-type domain-containing protein n=2 Tax=Roseivirga seohaensis TaxID=1914963 RepID=A0A0L8AKE7_9BACT|nr:hypothetical protein [Roseivirga seohaensis]KOF02702.1 hypothetical protein OB69_10320 [Roseivirga seohaensis subsp. aquiponti]KYG84829.1 hypothetical protein AWW67_01925 [Roseivirga seohaensis]